MYLLPIATDLVVDSIVTSKRFLSRGRGVANEYITFVSGGEQERSALPPF